MDSCFPQFSGLYEIICQFGSTIQTSLTSKHCGSFSKCSLRPSMCWYSFTSTALPVERTELHWWHSGYVLWCLGSLLQHPERRRPPTTDILHHRLLKIITRPQLEMCSPDLHHTCQLTEGSFISCSNLVWTALWKTLVSYRSSPNWPLRAAWAGLSCRNITRSGFGSPTSGCLHQSRQKPWRRWEDRSSAAHFPKAQVRLKDAGKKTHWLGTGEGHPREGISIDHKSGALLQLLLHQRSVVKGYFN